LSKIEPLSANAKFDVGEASGVAARMGKALNQAATHGVD
jgi:hypothetical protein